MAFLKRLWNGPFVYQENLGGLCSTCSTYGYDVFKELANLIIQNIEDQELQIYISSNSVLHFSNYKILKKNSKLITQLDTFA